MKEVNDLKTNEAQVEKQREKGASLVEYALLVALIAVIAIVAIQAVGTSVSAQFSKVSNSLNS